MLRGCTLIVTFLIVLAVAPEVAFARRFLVSNGPILTITLKDDEINARNAEKSDPTTADSARQSWMPSRFSSRLPNWFYSVSSGQPPLPNRLPSLKSLAIGAGYQYPKPATVHPSTFPLLSWIECTANFETDWMQLQVQPSHELHSARTNLLLQASRGVHYAFAKISRGYNDINSSSNNNNNKDNNAKNTRKAASIQLEAVRISTYLDLPFAALAAIRVTPTINCVSRDLTCDLEAITGGKGNSKAILHLEYERPTLAVQYQPDVRNLIRPVIDLYSGKIVYNWILTLHNGGSITTEINPDKAITMQWIDPALAGGWVTNVSLPLEKPWQPSVRVRRQFRL